MAPFPAPAPGRPRRHARRGRHVRQRHADLLALPPGRGPQPQGRSCPACEQITLGGEASPRRPAGGSPGHVPRRPDVPGLRVDRVRLHHLGARRVARASPSTPSSASRTPPPTCASRTASCGCAPARGCSATPASRAGGWTPPPRSASGAARVTSSRSSATASLFRGRTSEVINVGGRQGPPTARRGPDRRARPRGAGPRLRPPQQADRLHRRRRHRARRRRRPPPTSSTIRRDVKEAVADLPRAWQPRSITLVDTIETRGGKTVRGTEA